MSTTKPVDPNEIAQQEAKLRADADAKIAALSAQRNAESLRRAPLNRLIADRQLIADAIARAAPHRLVYAQRARLFRERIDSIFSSGNPGEAGTAFCVFDHDIAETHAERIIVELDRWLDARRVELSEATAAVLQLAAELGLNALLPDDLRAVSAA